MKNLSISRLRDLVHQYLDEVGILHRFDVCYTFTETSDVLLFTLFEPQKTSMDLVKSIQYFEGISSIHILESSQPCLYYLEVIHPHPHE